MNNITIEEAYQNIMDKKYLSIIDVRSKVEFEEGHIEGSINIPHDELLDKIHDLKQYCDRPVLVYCRTGERSEAAADLLQKQHFTKVDNMENGIHQWNHHLER